MTRKQIKRGSHSERNQHQTVGFSRQVKGLSTRLELCWQTRGFTRMQKCSPSSMEKFVVLQDVAGWCQTNRALLCLCKRTDTSTSIVTLCYGFSEFSSHRCRKLQMCVKLT